MAWLTYMGRDGYFDPEDDEVSLLDAFYYSTVSITTTGYGDVRPVSDTARLVTTVLVTPARILFLILLVGTTLEILAERSRQAVRRSIWRKRLKDHVIICGYGTKGRSAARTLLGKGISRDALVVLDEDPDARARANAQGLAAVAGSATSTDALREAGIEGARSVLVAVDRDDSAVLATLTARELNRDATIVAAVREEENVHLLHQSGATSVITSSGAAGRLLGHAVHEPRVTEVLEDLLSVGEGLDIAASAGPRARDRPAQRLRGGRPRDRRHPGRPGDALRRPARGTARGARPGGLSTQPCGRRCRAGVAASRAPEASTRPGRRASGSAARRRR